MTAGKRFLTSGAAALAALGVLALLLSTVAAANQLEVRKAHRGDVIEFRGGWTTRLTGIRAPDTTEAVGHEALAFTRRAVEGKTVTVFTFTTDNTAAGIVRGADNMPFARILYGHIPPGKGAGAKSPVLLDLNAELLRRGYARVDSLFAFDELGKYRALERQARGRKLGIWGTGTAAPIR